MTFTTKSVTVILIFTFFLLSIEMQLASSTFIPRFFTDTPSSFSSSHEHSSSHKHSSSHGYSPTSAPSQGGNKLHVGVGVGVGLFPDISLPAVSVDLELRAEGVTKPSVENQAKVVLVVEKSMQLVEQKIIEFNLVLKKRLEDPKTSASTKECINQCDQAYGTAAIDIKKSIQALNKGSLLKANVDIKAVSINCDACQKCFNDIMGECPELKRFDEWVQGITAQASVSLEGVCS